MQKQKHKTNTRQSHTEKWTSKSERGTKNKQTKNRLRWGDGVTWDGRVAGWMEKGELVGGQLLGDESRKLEMKVDCERGGKKFLDRSSRPGFQLTGTELESRHHQAGGSNCHS